MSTWPMVSLGEVLQLQRRWVKVDLLGTYEEIGVRCFGNGIFHKAPIDGSTLGNKRVLRIEPGDLVFNNVFAWEGAVAVASEAEAGKIGSHRFVTYTVDPARCSADYLRWFFKCEPGLDVLRRVSPGSAGRNRTMSLDLLPKQEIPLPPLSEQQRLVEYFDSLSAKIDEAKRLIEETSRGLDELCRSVFRNTTDGDPRPTPMAELVRLREPDVEVRADEVYHFAGVYCFGRGVFVGQKKSGMDFKYSRLTRLRTDDFVYPKLMAWEGALGVVPAECDGLVVSTEFPVFEIDQDKVLPEVLDVFFKNPSIWPELSGASTGTNVRRRRLNPADFLKFQMPLPSRGTQQRIRDLRSRIQTIAENRATTNKELEAMLPAVLDQAFNGQEQGEDA